MSLNFVQGDTKPDLLGVINYIDPDTGEVGDPVNLTGATVVFQMRKPDDRRYTVNAVATVTDAPNGAVRYSWAANDLATHGTFQAQFEVTFSDMTIQTSTPPAELIVRRQ